MLINDCPKSGVHERDLARSLVFCPLRSGDVLVPLMVYQDILDSFLLTQLTFPNT